MSTNFMWPNLLVFYECCPVHSYSTNTKAQSNIYKFDKFNTEKG